MDMYAVVVLLISYFIYVRIFCIGSGFVGDRQNVVGMRT